MAGAKPWRPLRLSEQGGLPPLLVAFETKASEYSIRITDMAHVWTESLERKAICIRAWGENTSIDPSDTPENMGKFLQTIQSALDETTAAKPEHTVTLSPGSSTHAGEDGLQLVATCELLGFEPLKWPFHLKKSSPTSVANDFAVPLIETLYSKSLQVDMLVQALKHKDAVISKLSDKLEATGTGLEHVFTALSGRKKVTREAADDKIRGLAPFNERKMMNDLRDNADQPYDVMDLVQKVFGDRAIFSDTAIQLTPGRLEGWWRSFSSTSSLPHRTATALEKQAAPLQEAIPSSPPDTNDVTMGDDDDDDEFQIQSTPPRLKPKKENQPKDAVGASSKSQWPATAIKEEHRSSQEPNRAGRIGAIGGKRQASPPSAPKKVSPTRPTTKTAKADDDETASETASDVDETASLPDEAPSPQPAPSPPPAKVPAKKSGLGRIGGKPKPPVHDSETPDDAAAPAHASTVARGGEGGSTAPKRLGVIGKRTGGSTEAPGDAIKDDVQRGRTTSRNASAEAGERETSQERADRKREELKRELEKKAAAGPAKKKRRF
ncbi:XLF family protein [Cordyceps javanica]|uniref:Non-homologous end-joining factor 1 n=1 Tax=Cordyceps javanica TaxID=43265 RepID=A0A545W138_9HYPO|nr:XLF family protein [Cordyceps javanica]TQW07636.1 XLF family protein [Cordyceps javanica]